MGEAKVKSYTRKTKSGKTVQVRAHSRKCEGGSCGKTGAGVELANKLKSFNNRFDRTDHLKKLGYQDDGSDRILHSSWVHKDTGEKILLGTDGNILKRRAKGCGGAKKKSKVK